MFFCFFYKHIFLGDQASDMLSQNLEGGSNYACELCLIMYHGVGNLLRPGNSSETNQDRLRTPWE